ncbi:hypothetical protein M231_00130 [Tremella mesenterica]|uniref:Uncharacterized protein n=1 Tax=Tremella mesenterica TaxID=5217 RepID=A0A4Q1BWW7_TREME|nr:hypothetical protein M231_00130 [Tremella mesenterica]
MQYPNQTEDIRTTLYHLLDNLKPFSTLCPSSVARQLHKQDPVRYPVWRVLMDSVRDVVWDEVQRGNVEVTQGGTVRTWDEKEKIKGPIRVRKPMKTTQESG